MKWKPGTPESTHTHEGKNIAANWKPKPGEWKKQQQQQQRQMKLNNSQFIIFKA